MIEGLVALFGIRQSIGIDPGSSQLRIVTGGQLVYEEPSLIVVDESSHAITETGLAAEQSGKAARRPIDGVLADFYGTEKLFSAALKKIPGKSVIPLKLSILFCIPAGVTEVDRMAYRDIAGHCNASEVRMIFQSCCSAIGRGILFEKKNFILIDFGYSKVEITIFADGLIISEEIIWMGLGKVIQLLKNHFWREHSVHLSDKEILFLLNQFSNGASLVSVNALSVEKGSIDELLSGLFFLINDACKEAVERVSRNPFLSRALQAGIYFTGGGSAIKYLQAKISVGAGVIPVSIGPTPWHDNVEGLKRVMTEPESYKGYIFA